MLFFSVSIKKELSNVGQKRVMAKLELIKNMCHTKIKSLVTVVHTSAPPTCIHYILKQQPSCADPHPVVLLRSDNSSSESWTRKGASISYASCALGRLQCALMMQKPIGLCIKHISTPKNVVVDNFSCIPSEADLITSFSTLLPKRIYVVVFDSNHMQS